MRPILFQVMDLYYVHSGHFMLFLGALAGIVLLGLEMKRIGEDPEKIYLLLILLFLSALYGARFLYWINLRDQLDYGLLPVLTLQKGGMALHGGALLAFLVYVAYTKWQRLDFWRIGDLLSLPTALFVFLARLGCFLSGCCYGKQCPADFPLAVTFTNKAAAAPKDVPLYPTQLLFSAAVLAVFVYLWLRRRHKRFQGEIGLAGVALFSFLSFFIEFLRGDIWVFYEVFGMAFTQNQLINAGLFLVTTSLYFHRKGCDP